jgi:CheY-like chemotaxis protein
MCGETKKGTVVVIDDEYHISVFAKAVLGNREGYNVLTYDNGQKAIDALNDMLSNGDCPLDISVILSDIQMPGKNGPTTVKEILSIYNQRDDELPVPEVRFMSGMYSSTEGSRARYISGGHDIIEKPFNLDKLKEVVDSANSEFYARMADNS